MNWLYYIAEANLYLGVFYLAYCLFLSKETHYQLNRGYLLAACALAFLIPVVQLGFLVPVQYLVLDDTPVVATVAPTFTWLHALLYLYITGIVVFAARFMVKLYQLKKIISNNTLVPADGYQIVTIDGADTAFSFFNYLFVGTRTNEAALITRHELVHIRQKHSLDIVLVELLQIISWFNPAIYLLQNSLKTVHEYEADEQTTRTETDTITYATYLLNNAYGISGPAMTHSFFNYNLLKKRITMLHQKRSGNLARLKYLIAAPLCMGLLYQSTFGFDKTYGLINIAPKAPVMVQATATDTVPAKSEKPKAVIEQVVVADKNGALIDIRTKKGKAIQVENLAKEKAKGYIKRTKGETTEGANNPEVPAANVEQLLDGKVKGYVIRTREPKTGSYTIIDKTGETATDPSNKDGKVKGLNIQNPTNDQAFYRDKDGKLVDANSPEAVNQRAKVIVARATDGSANMKGRLVITDGKNGDATKDAATIRIEQPQTEMRIEEPQQDPNKIAPPPPPMPPVKKKTIINKNAPKPDVSKIKFPPPQPKPPVKKVTKRQPPPPPMSPAEQKKAGIKFPPPIVKPDAPAKKVVRFPPSVVKPDVK